MRFTVDTMESSAQIPAIELLVVSSVRVLRLLAVLGDTIGFSLLVNGEGSGAEQARGTGALQKSERRIR